MSTVLAFLKKRFENCAKRLANKRNLDHLELLFKHVILEIEDKLSLMSDQLSCCVEELKREDNKIVRAEEEIQCLGQVLKLAASFKDTPKEKSKNYVLKNSKIKRIKETNRFGLSKRIKWKKKK
jgi:predicted RecB family endonuclease